MIANSQPQYWFRENFTNWRISSQSVSVHEMEIKYIYSLRLFIRVKKKMWWNEINKHRSIKQWHPFPVKYIRLAYDIWFRCFPNKIFSIFIWGRNILNIIWLNRSVWFETSCLHNRMIGKLQRCSSKMSQENQNSTRTPPSTPQKINQNDQYASQRTTLAGNVPNNCLRTLFEANQQTNMDSSTNRKPNEKETSRRSCLRKSFDPKQTNRRVTFSSPLSRKQDYFTCQSAKALHRAIYPPSKHPCMIYMNTRLQQERRRQQSHQDGSITSMQIKWSAPTWKIMFMIHQFV